MNKALETTKTIIEMLWKLAVIVWNIPVAIIEFIWLLIFDRDSLKTNISNLKETLNDRGI